MNCSHENKKLEEMPEILTARMIADYLNIGYSKALHLIQYEGIQHLKLGSTYRVPKQHFVEWLGLKS